MEPQDSRLAILKQLVKTLMQHLVNMHLNTRSRSTTLTFKLVAEHFPSVTRYGDAFLGSQAADLKALYSRPSQHLKGYKL
jgi:hypothetical protein